MKNGFTTTILHSDLESPIEHYSVHKPIHTAVAVATRVAIPASRIIPRFHSVREA